MFILSCCHIVPSSGDKKLHQLHKMTRVHRSRIYASGDAVLAIIAANRPTAMIDGEASWAIGFGWTSLPSGRLRWRKSHSWLLFDVKLCEIWLLRRTGTMLTNGFLFKLWGDCPHSLQKILKYTIVFKLRGSPLTYKNVLFNSANSCVGVEKPNSGQNTGSKITLYVIFLVVLQWLTKM